jgi:UDP-MurNAc hydroxylase
MKIRKLGSATVLIETKDSRILCDPWLTDGAYYGSWCNYPPINLDEYDLSNLDFIYISHIHPDHFDPQTMERIDNSTPVLIHHYHQPFLKRNIERIGFNVIELDNAVSFDVSGTTKITIYAADNCDPTICGHMFGCIDKDVNGSMQIDSLCVIEDDAFTLVNTNDCPYEIAEQALAEIKKNHKKIDFALVGYTSASLYPHCMIRYNQAEMEIGIQRAQLRGLTTAQRTLEKLQPNFYMPFAGTYILGGANYQKNENLPIPEIQDAVQYLQKELSASGIELSPVLLNYNEFFDLETELPSNKYSPISKLDRASYISSTARKFKYSYEDDEYPSDEVICDLFSNAIPRLKRKQLEVGLFEDIHLIFDLPGGSFGVINLKELEFYKVDDIQEIQNYQRFVLDPRLLRRALTGPHLANWNNIEIGAHLDFDRQPDVFRQDIHILVNALHI